MKTVRNFLSVMLIMLMSGAATDLLAQGRGHGRKHDNPGQHKKTERDWDRGNHRDDGRHYDRHDHRDSHDDYSSRNNRYYHHKSYVKYHHRHDHRWAPAYGHRYNTRYIYYRDYDVYYDCYRDVFVTWTGRNWIITSRIPDAIVRVDFRRTAVVGVDYWDDDFDFYLARRRPAFVSIQASF
jgi:hypothetical protein